MSNEWNDRAEVFLTNLGFECEAEPDWLPVGGKKPDFFCSGPLDVWVEVKAFLPGSRYAQMLRLWDDLQKRTSAIEGEGWAHTNIATKATDKDMKAGAHLLAKAIAHPERQRSAEVLVSIPSRPDYGKLVEFSYASEHGRIWAITCLARDGVYGCPFALEPSPWQQVIELVSDGEHVAAGPAYEIVHSTAVRLAMRVINDQMPFRLLSVSVAEGARNAKSITRIREAIREANSQLKAGNRCRKAPTVLVVYDTTFPTPDELMVMSAILGDLTYVLSSGSLKFGKNQAWQRNKNRSISALCYLRDGAIPLTFHHPWANHRLPVGVFGGREYVPAEDGSFEIIDHTDSV